MKNSFDEFVSIVYRLRKECPWDREQTNDSIKSATIEEAYEVVEAIDQNNFNELKKELGDLLLHVVFHTIIAEESGKFTIKEVIESIKEKLIRRHPHVFGDAKVNGTDEVKQNWESIKLSEGRYSVLEGVPVTLPALQRAHRLQEKAAKVGFDWETKEDVWKKVIEEINEMQEAESNASTIENEEKYRKELVEEVGDVLFAFVNYSRFLKINPEEALRITNEKFIKRFGYVQQKVESTGKKITESNLKEMDVYWEESKNKI